MVVLLRFWLLKLWNKKGVGILGENLTLYVYRVIREDLATGKRGKRSKRYSCFSPELAVGGLYLHLGPGYPGAQRVLDMTTEIVPV